jgi:hypothetical protein
LLEELIFGNCICNHQDFEVFIKNMNGEYSRYLDSDKYGLTCSKKFKEVSVALARAVRNVKSHMSELSEYDISKWVVDKNCMSKNIIKGLQKYGQEIILIIKPTEMKKIGLSRREEFDLIR